MSALATRTRARQMPLAPDRPRKSLDLERLVRERSGCPSDGGRLTLGQRLDGVWEGLRAAGEAICPLCGGAMHRHGAGSGGTCTRCGTQIS
jgi:hypothetical protein